MSGTNAPGHANACAAWLHELQRTLVYLTPNDVSSKSDPIWNEVLVSLSTLSPTPHAPRSPLARREEP
jgi:hypothetical protein